MTPRSVAVQGGLAGLALLAAYTTWQRAPELSAGEVFVLDITKTDLEKVRFEDQEGKAWSELAKGKDDKGQFVSVRMSGYDNSNIPMPAGHPGIPLKLPDRLVRGNDSATRLFERFAPLRASRALGVLDAGKQKELGLDTSKKFVEVTARGVKRRFAIVPAPPGGSDPYVRDLADNKVYIVPRQILSDMQAASTNLVDRRLHDFKLEEVDKVVLEAGGKRRELAASRYEDLPGVRLAPIETPDKPDPTIKNWHDRIFNLFASEVLGQGEVPTAGAPVPALKIEYFSRGRKVGFVEMGRAGGAAASSTATPPPQPDVYARSEHALGWLKMGPDAKPLLTEGEGFVNKK